MHYISQKSCSCCVAPCLPPNTPQAHFVYSWLVVAVFIILSVLFLHMYLPTHLCNRKACQPTYVTERPAKPLDLRPATWHAHNLTQCVTWSMLEPGRGRRELGVCMSNQKVLYKPHMPSDYTYKIVISKVSSKDMLTWFIIAM